jgi:hypothetical protein
MIIQVYLEIAMILSFPRRLEDELEVQVHVPYRYGNYVGLQPVNGRCLHGTMTVADNFRVRAGRNTLLPLLDKCPLAPCVTPTEACRSITRRFSPPHFHRIYGQGDS